jgi:hypothetical protein
MLKRMIWTLFVTILLIGITSVAYSAETVSSEEYMAAARAKRALEVPQQPVIVQPPQSNTVISLIQPPQIYPLNPQLLPGSVMNITHNLPRLSFPKAYRGEIINYKRVDSQNGWFADRIRVEDILPDLIKRAEYLWQKLGWNPLLMRYEVILKSSTQGFGFSGNPSAYASQYSSKPGESSSTSQSVGGSFGYSSSLTNPVFVIMLYEIMQEKENADSTITSPPLNFPGSRP